MRSVVCVSNKRTCRGDFLQGPEATCSMCCLITGSRSEPRGLRVVDIDFMNASRQWRYTSNLGGSGEEVSVTVCVEQ